MSAVKFTLTGTTPLLMHRDDPVVADELSAWRHDNKKQVTPGDDRTPPWTWQCYLYHDGESLALEREMIMKALSNAGSQVTLRKRTTMKRASQSGLFIREPFLEFRSGGEIVPLEDLASHRDDSFDKQTARAEKHGIKLFVKRATIGMAKHVRVRPRFDAWSVTGTIEILSDDITAETLKNLFAIAGRDSGLGDWRPSAPKSPGNFGMFTCELERVGRSSGGDEEERKPTRREAKEKTVSGPARH